MGLQVGSGLSTSAPAGIVGEGYAAVADWTALLALSPENEDRAYVKSHHAWLIYLAVGAGLWWPERFTSGAAGSVVVHEDVVVLLDANAGIAGLADGDDVVTWTNLGSSGDFAEATNPPSWHETAGADGRAVVRFAGASEILHCASKACLRNTGRGMAAALFKPATVSTTDRCIFNASVNTSDNGLFYFYYDTINRMAARRVSADGASVVASTTVGEIPSAGVWTTQLGIADWTANNMIVESDSVTTYTIGVDTSISTAGSTEDLDHNSVTVGKSGGLPDAADMDLGQLVVVRDEVFSRGDLVVLERYQRMIGGLSL